MVDSNSGAFIQNHLYICAMSDFPSFADYLRLKKIDAEVFQKAESDHYESLKVIYDQVHPDSFTAQKLFLINPLRRKYQLKISEEKPVMKPKAVKPKIPMPKPKTS